MDEAWSWGRKPGLFGKIQMHTYIMNTYILFYINYYYIYTHNIRYQMNIIESYRCKNSYIDYWIIYTLLNHIYIYYWIILIPTYILDFDIIYIYIKYYIQIHIYMYTYAHMPIPTSYIVYTRWVRINESVSVRSTIHHAWILAD